MEKEASCRNLIKISHKLKKKHQLKTKFVIKISPVYVSKIHDLKLTNLTKKNLGTLGKCLPICNPQNIIFGVAGTVCTYFILIHGMNFGIEIKTANRFNFTI